MRTTTCANEATGHRVRANKSASAIFFMVNEFLQIFRGLRNARFRPVEVFNGCPQNSCVQEIVSPCKRTSNQPQQNRALDKMHGRFAKWSEEL